MIPGHFSSSYITTIASLNDSSEKGWVLRLHLNYFRVYHTTKVKSARGRALSGGVRENTR